MAAVIEIAGCRQKRLSLPTWFQNATHCIDEFFTQQWAWYLKLNLKVVLVDGLFSWICKNNLFKYDQIIKLVTLTISIHSFDWTLPRNLGLEFQFGNSGRALTTSMISSEHLGTFRNICEHCKNLGTSKHFWSISERCGTFEPRLFDLFWSFINTCPLK